MEFPYDRGLSSNLFFGTYLPGTLTHSELNFKEYLLSWFYSIHTLKNNSDKNSSDDIFLIFLLMFDVLYIVIVILFILKKIILHHFVLRPDRKKKKIPYTDMNCSTAIVYFSGEDII
ncbi:hypothetical protein PFDG_05258 [Plasmodium falciparum Dd2]|uniref:Uncharacterized protein n=1 Tax=Plasmodium falciparum (isolate Dd2) TaxID=57267 RepID=A0A0L7MA57_PLAF4|nr:hypothetical protein PFDG_05258 [Plasmodium falciparum Dd2]